MNDDLTALHASAVELCGRGRYRDAIPLFERVLTGCRERVSADHPNLLIVAGNLGVAYTAAGRRRAGLALLVASVADRARTYGETAAATMTARDALAVAYRLAGDGKNAVALSGQVAAQRRRVLGATHPDTLTSRMGLAAALDASGDRSSAVATLTVAIEDAQQSLGDRHPHTRALLECGEYIGLDRGA